ncbi:beta-lactamase [Coniosporium apollinis CBS 100218]|uniref:Beta-lactamase n=1 Tax=Coniosporium apollinis (strain CBS 100218) TaxID=1168221 RepID=R7Z6F2_CONA1|nr:beta-lactamase [Coniosporium apollinis CBS 100218]EON69770.1 beta-lactamase [Coniosporium apollinis CBS 100218]
MAASIILADNATVNIKQAIDRAVQTAQIPGAIIRIVNAGGHAIFSYASGSVAPIGNPAARHDLLEDDIASIWSLSKLVTSTALLQLVDAGVLDLDDPAIIERTLPELASKQILVGFENSTIEGRRKKPILVPRETNITARMLLTHTAGISQSFFEPLLQEFWGDELATKGEMVDYWNNLKTTPLTTQPGTTWSYGSATDWAGVLVERLSNSSLAGYFSREIFQPLEMSDSSFDAHMPPQDSKRVFPPYMKHPNGSLVADTHWWNGPTPEAPGPFFPDSDEHRYMGASGLAMTAPDYGVLLATLLNGGVCPASGVRLLSKTSVDAIFSSQLSSEVAFSGVVGVPGPLAVPADLKVHDPEVGIGLAGSAVSRNDRLLSDGRVGRKAGSAYWYGLKNAEWWVDRAAGIGVVMFSNYLPWNDAAWLKLVDSVESEIYAGVSDPEADCIGNSAQNGFPGSL